MDREEVARLWFEEDFVPVVEALRDGGFIRTAESEGDAYMRVVGARYELLRTHEWSDEVLDRLRASSAAGADPAGDGASPGAGAVARPGREQSSSWRPRRADLVALPGRRWPGSRDRRARSAAASTSTAVDDDECARSWTSWSCSSSPAGS